MNKKETVTVNSLPFRDRPRKFHAAGESVEGRHRVSGHAPHGPHGQRVRQAQGLRAVVARVLGRRALRQPGHGQSVYAAAFHQGRERRREVEIKGINLQPG